MAPCCVPGWKPRASSVSADHERAGASTRIQCDELLLLGEPDEREHVAADACHMRLGHAQHRRRRDRCVDGVAALTQDLEPSLGGKRLARGDHAVRRVDGGAAGQSGWALGVKHDWGGEERRERTGSNDHAEAGHPDPIREGEGTDGAGHAN